MITETQNLEWYDAIKWLNSDEGFIWSLHNHAQIVFSLTLKGKYHKEIIKTWDYELVDPDYYFRDTQLFWEWQDRITNYPYYLFPEEY